MIKYNKNQKIKNGYKVYLKVVSLKSLLFSFMSGKTYEYESRIVRGVNWKTDELLLEDENGNVKWFSMDKCFKNI